MQAEQDQRHQLCTWHVSACLAKQGTLPSMYLLSIPGGMAVAGAPRTVSAVTPVDHAGGGGNLGAELAHAKRREAEATTRVAALEAKLKSTSSVQGEMQASVQELSHRLQVLQHPPWFSDLHHLHDTYSTRIPIVHAMTAVLGLP